MVRRSEYMRKIIVILGTTASGKSDLGVRLAKKFGGVVISADSRQVYKGMNIGTGKITKKEMRGVPHYLLDIASPKSQYSVARYVWDVKRVLDKLEPTIPVFLVGGSPFYIDAIIKTGSFSDVPPNKKLRARLEKLNANQLVNKLTSLDPLRVKRVDQKNKRRLIRAIEIAEAMKNGMYKKSVQLPDMRTLKIGITFPRPTLNRRIDTRVDVRMREGMVREVQKLHTKGVSWRRLDDFGLEYRFLCRYLQGEAQKENAVAQLKTAIHQFAKRQMTWFKRDAEIYWIKNRQEANTLVSKFLYKR